MSANSIAKRGIGPVQIGIILLGLATALIHLVLGIRILQGGGDPLFILNAIGYVVLITALFLPQLRAYQNYVRWALIAYTAITIIAWVFMGDMTMLLGIVTKIIEILLIVLLLIDSRS